ncbi:class I SAM-dependent DNA methyltransferase [Roseibium algae]|uniref:Class I SAM-dependent methyltransferase n=1 Tax=Roseibium algae TaxID=3123038 RepID=A0ABU8TIA6_9HYPH
MQDSNETIHASHDLDGDISKIKNYYKDWAANYDQDVKDQSYGGPEVIGNLASLIAVSYLHKQPENVRVLDAGCGTGLSGLALQETGFKVVDGFDLSDEMVMEAEKTGAYKELRGSVDITVDRISVFDRKYDLVVSCGVFTLGHVEPEALLTLARLLTKDGHLAVSTRNSYLSGSDFKKESQDLVRRGLLEEILIIPDARYIAEEDAHYWVYKRGPKLT